MNYIHSFQSEWLKTKHSAASWLTIIGGFFIPVIMLVAQFVHYKELPAAYAAPNFWYKHFSNSWQTMAFFLLPMGVILASSLITQLEFRNNAWKQLLCTPQTLTGIFFTKLLVILVMMFQFFTLFNIGIYLSGVLPSFILSNVSYPKAPIPFAAFLKWDALFFIDCLPIIALQYLLSLLFKNFLVPIGAGLAIFMAALIANSWKYVYIIPYSYCTLAFMSTQGRYSGSIHIHLMAIGYFAVFIIAGYLLFITRKEKG